MKITKEKIVEIRRMAEEVSDDARDLRRRADKLLDVCDSLDEDGHDDAYA